MSERKGNFQFSLPQTIQPGSLKTISKGKLATFAVGQQKKSRFQKAREEKEQRQKQEEAEAAKVYESFVASFEVDESSKTFIRGGRVQDDEIGGKGKEVFGGTSGDVYKLKSQRGEGRPGSQASGAPRSDTKSKLSNMELMLQEMKERECQREQRKSEGDGGRAGRERSRSRDFSTSSATSASTTAVDIVAISTHHLPADFMGSSLGSFHDGDPTTTNLYVGNLAPSCTEELLCEIFGRFGPINSAKVMWPRTDEEKARKRNCGFVSFVHRADAEDALAELNDSLLEGHHISVGWGKAVKIMATPRYVRTAPIPKPPPPPPASKSSEAKILSAEKKMDSSVLEMPLMPSTNEKSCSNAAMQENIIKQMSDCSQIPEGATRIHVTLPSSLEQRQLVDTLAKYVAVDGSALEQAIRARESNNPAFSFLRPSPTNTVDGSNTGREDDQALRDYYRWRTVAYLMGSERDYWRETPFQLVYDGPYWIPPRVPVLPERQSPTTSTKSKHHKRNCSRSRSRSGSASPVSGHGGSAKRRRRTSRSSSRSRGREEQRSRSRDKKGDRDRDRDAMEVSSHWRNLGGDNTGEQSNAGNDKERQHDRRSKYAGMTGAQIERARAKERGSRGARLSQRKYDEFSTILSSLELSKSSICNAMGFALDHTEAAEDIVKVLSRSVLAEGASPPLRIARLYLISDILHNSGAAVKNASLFRTHIQAALPSLFDALNQWKRRSPSLQGRMSATQFEERILGILRAWSQWAIFPPGYLVGLEALMFRTESDVKKCEELETHQGDSDLDDETIKRKARLVGLALSTIPMSEEGRKPDAASVPVPTIRLLHQLEFVKEFSFARSRIHLNDEQLLEDEDIDGSRMDASRHMDHNRNEGSESIVNLLDGVSKSSNVQEEEYEMDDDVDGVPISDAYEEQHVAYDDDDVDGIPMDE